MQKELEHSKLHKTIEVKGMNGLNTNYIYRFFSHAGPVEQVKKIQDLVIIRFKNQNSINKALRFSGRIIDKQPIKIRSSYQNIEVPNKQQINRTQYLMNEVLKDKSFDVPYFWASVLKIINKIQDRKIRWIIHQIFFIKLSQVIHYYAFSSNMRSTYLQIILKEILFNQGKGTIQMSQCHDKIQKLQMFSIIGNDLSDEVNFETILSPLDLRLKTKFREILNNIQGNRLYLLYSLFHTYSLHIPQGQSIFSHQNSLEFYHPGQSFSISKQIVTKSRARICLKEGSCGIRRSQYRNIDNEHPNKQIQILSDCSTENLMEDTTYDIFKDNFDGNITNNCAADIFYDLRYHFAPNDIIIRCYELGKLNSIRLDFELRLLNCQNQKLIQHNFCKYINVLSPNIFQQISQIILMKHNVVLADFQNTDKVIYLLQNYLKVFCDLTSIKKKQNINFIQKLLVVLILSNSCQIKYQKIKSLCDQIYNNKLIQDNICINIIEIQDYEKFEKFKCSNFIEEYLDHQKGGTFNLQIARVHAKLLIEGHSHKFYLIKHPQEFVTQEIWRLEQQKNKRAAKNKIKMHLRNARCQ